MSDSVNVTEWQQSQWRWFVLLYYWARFADIRLTHLPSIGSEERQKIAIVTPTWSGDLEQFQLLRWSLEMLGMGNVPHYAVVHSEDVRWFQPLKRGIASSTKGHCGLEIVTTAEVLPPDVEAGRMRYLRKSEGKSRHWLRTLRSWEKRLGWFPWIRYSGWQTQQIVKLSAAEKLGIDTCIIIDSDTFAIRPFEVKDCRPSGRSLWLPGRQIPNRERDHVAFRWAENAHRLLDVPWPKNHLIPYRVGTPVIFDRMALKGLLDRLSQHGLPWYQKLIEQAPASWSEFALYNCFVDNFFRQGVVEPENASPWGAYSVAGDGSETDARILIQQAFAKNDRYFFTLQSGARERTGRELDIPSLMPLIRDLYQSRPLPLLEANRELPSKGVAALKRPVAAVGRHAGAEFPA